MGHRGRELAFSEETLLRGVAIQEVAGENFERDGASEEEVSRFEDHTHSAGANSLGQLEVTDHAPAVDVGRKHLRAHGEQWSVISQFRLC